MNEPVPKGWRVLELGDAFNISIGGTPSRSVPEYWDVTRKSGYPWVSIRDLNCRNIHDTSEYITDLGVSNSNVKLVSRGTVMMSFKLSIGRTAIAGVDLYTNEAIAAFVPYADAIHSNFLYYGLQHWDLLGDIDQAVKGVTLNKEKLRSIEALVPPSAEQQKIATVLSSVDDVIEKTRAQIDKLKDLKTGMMQELLTQGIGHKEFKDSPVGRIPASWETKTLGQITSLIKSGLSRRIVSKDIGIPLLSSGNIQNHRLDTAELKYWYVNDPQGANTNSYILNDGDILVCFINSISQIGKSCIYRDIGRPAIYTTNLFRVVPRPEYSSEYLQIIFTTQRFQNGIQLITKPAVNQASFTKADFEQLSVPVPPPKERGVITESIMSVENRIDAADRKLNEMKDVKKGLMQDLLTGKVRVETEQQESEVA